MTATTIRVQMAQRKDTAANWTAANPILLSGEIGYETDTKKFKIGNGSTAWNSLAYLPIPDGSGNLTITGNLEIGSTGSLTFEGSTADGFETTLAVTNPTADRTITLPDVTGTVVTTGDTGSVTSTMIANGTIVDADVSSTAEIAVSKLANGTANQVIVTDGTNVSWSDNLTLAGDLTVNGTTTTINTQDLLVEDKNIIIGNVATPSDVTADGGGITLKGATDKTINWVDATDAWTLSEHVNIASGKEYRIAGTKVLDATSLGSSILITSANITDGTIVDSDISATAEIAVSKLADGTARQLLQTDAAGTGVEWASNIDIPGTLDVTGAATLDSTLSVPLGSAGSPSIYPGTDTNTGIYSPGADQLAISTGSTGRLFVDASGNIGVGAAASSSGKLRVVGGNAANCLIDNDGSQYTQLLVQRNSTINTGGDLLADGTAGTFSIRSLVGPLVFTAGTPGIPSERARIRADGMFEVKGAGTAGSSPAFSINGSAPASSLVVDSSGRTLFGTSTNGGPYVGINPQIQLEGISYDGSSVSTYCNNTNPQTCSILSVSRSRGTAIGSTTVVQSGDRLGVVLYSGADGTNRGVVATAIESFVDGTATTVAGSFVINRRYKIATIGTTDFTLIGAASNTVGVIFTATGAGAGTGTATSEPYLNSMPGRIVFSTTSDGQSFATERLRITSAGVMQIANAGNIAVGTTTGTKIGTATTQKLGFYNATPVVQPSAVADITTTATTGTLPTADGSVTIADAAAPTVAELLEYCVELEAKLETALSRLRSLGLIAT